MDLWPVDIRRFGAFHNNDQFLKERAIESLGIHYNIPWPRFELQSGSKQYNHYELFHNNFVQEDHSGDHHCMTD
jgi:hypothetical protein